MRLREGEEARRARREWVEGAVGGGGGLVVGFGLEDCWRERGGQGGGVGEEVHLVDFLSLAVLAMVDGGVEGDSWNLFCGTELGK